MRLYIITYRIEQDGKVWSSERYAPNAREALAGFLKAVAKIKTVTIRFLGIYDYDGTATFSLVD